MGRLATAARTVTAEDVAREAMAENLPQATQQAWVDEAADCVRRYGVIVIRNAIPAQAIAAVLEDFKVRHDVHMAPGQKKLYRTFQSDPLRAQVPMPIDGPVADPRVFAPPSVMALVRRLLGDELTVGESGLVISHAGAGFQEAHRDSDFLFGGLDMEVDLPPYAMTMLLPLVDVSLDMGPTEYWPGSHRIRDDGAVMAAPSQRMALKAGTVVLLDSRVLHRGGAHFSGPVRPTAYFSFHRPWYLEGPGFEFKPQVRVTPAMLRRLPEQYRPLFAWALHLNRSASVSDFAHRWAGHIRKRVRALKGA